MQLSLNLQSNIFWNNFTASLCISHISSQKEDNCPAQKIHAQGQQDKNNTKGLKCV